MIPDTVMGLSLVAFGSSVPDCLSSLFVAQKGERVIHPSFISCSTVITEDCYKHFKIKINDKKIRRFDDLLLSLQ